MRQLTDDDLLARGYAVTHPAGSAVIAPVPGWHQLLYAGSGVLRVETAGAVRVLPPHRALWLPDGSTAHTVALGRALVRTLYLRSRWPPAARAEAGCVPPWPAGEAVPGRGPRRAWGEPIAVDVPPLLRELVLHAVRACPLVRDDAEHRRLIAFLGDRLAAAPEAPERLPLPADPRALALARVLQADPASTEPIRGLAAGTGAGVRTLERLFLAQTGMTIARWRQRARLVAAVELLGRGEPVTAVAAAVGYATPSAFTAMFRAHLGRTPREVSRDPRGASAGGRPR